MASLRCHGNSDVNQTSNHNNISSLIIQHSCINLSDISVNGNVVNAQTGDLSRKIQTRQLKCLDLTKFSYLITVLIIFPSSYSA